MKRSGHFWVGYSDLMTSMFFILLILFFASFVLLKTQTKELGKCKRELQETKKKVLVAEEKARLLEQVEQNLAPLKQNKSLFRYEKKYKRYTLAFDVKFHTGETEISAQGLVNPDQTIKYIDNAGKALYSVIRRLALNRKTNKKMKDVSYVVIIAGYASHLPGNLQETEYLRSYKRAYNLWKHWKELGIDFESREYSQFIDLQIAGNGWGGIGRYLRDPEKNFMNERKNQRFIIQIVPKIAKGD